MQMDEGEPEILEHCNMFTVQTANLYYKVLARCHPTLRRYQSWPELPILWKNLHWIPVQPNYQHPTGSDKATKEAALLSEPDSPVRGLFGVVEAFIKHRVKDEDPAH